MTDTWCWPLCHDWSKWEGVTFSVATLIGGVKVGESHDKLGQSRECKRCGLMQTRFL